MAAAPVTAARLRPAEGSTTATGILARIDLISSSALFTGLSPDAYEEIARRALPRAFARDQLLLRQGEPARSVALIRTGSVKITQLAPNGNEVILWMYGPGNAVGALSEHGSQIHSGSVRAMEPCTALVWEHKVFQGLMAQHAQIRMNTSQILVSRLSELEERFREVATEKVARRTALALLRLVKHVGKRVQDGVEVSLSREELAQMTGTTLFTTSRILSRWGRMGIILPSRAAVLVRDAHRLELAGEDPTVEDAAPGCRYIAGSLRAQPAGVFGLPMLNNGSRLASEARC